MALKEGDSVASIARLEGKGGSNSAKDANAAAPEAAPKAPAPAKPPAAKRQSSAKK
jgi:hypothetical protein